MPPHQHGYKITHKVTSDCLAEASVLAETSRRPNIRSIMTIRTGVKTTISAAAECAQKHFSPETNTYCELIIKTEFVFIHNKTAVHNTANTEPLNNQSYQTLGHFRRLQ